MQRVTGLWWRARRSAIRLVQFCHGPLGFVVSLLAIRPHFSNMQTQIDEAIRRGLLTKEPNICHGITGNALALEAPQRNHFLCLATPERTEQSVADGLFEKDRVPFEMP
jgi:hypothetical protein